MRSTRGILSTPPLPIQEAPLCILSCVSHLDLMMYLVSIKSFYRFMGRGEIVILNDGTLTPADKDLLHHHVSPREIVNLDDVPFDGTKGVRWGIILKVADLIEDNYVVQLDSDTITSRSISEVTDSVENGRAFPAGTKDGLSIVPMREMCEEMKSSVSHHVQVVAEQNLDRLPSYQTGHYVRGDSGLVGFPRGSFQRSDVEFFLESMTDAIGDKFLERGSYLVCSNTMVANSPHAWVLPIEKYVAYRPETRIDNAAWVHYFGKHRFTDPTYVKDATATVQELLLQAESESRSRG